MNKLGFPFGHLTHNWRLIGVVIRIFEFPVRFINQGQRGANRAYRTEIASVCVVQRIFIIK
ncbi:hypothetical protein B0I31_117106 [Saccharothrix carnea]|uniref:Uncharacterized protein n=1 Tax=Saccharothrix carnea TaxID=1280637 RepID=A0A2P8I0C9_SACCR|nr:hypothetical protein B0I31_117106 [Saccharothrix carnea]